MRVLVSLVALLVTLDARAEPEAVRLAVAHAGELLPSEAKSLAAAQKKLARRATVTVADASAAEVAFAAAPSGQTLPAEWQGAATVVVLQVLPPSGDKGKRVSRGAGSVLVFRPPNGTPVYAERVEGDAALSLHPQTVAAWLEDMLVLGARAGGAK